MNDREFSMLALCASLFLWITTNGSKTARILTIVSALFVMLDASSKLIKELKADED